MDAFLEKFNLTEKGEVLKMVFQHALSTNTFNISPVEYEKLWRKFDVNNSGLVPIETFLNKLSSSNMSDKPVSFFYIIRNTVQSP